MVKVIQNHNDCIGCGACTAVCPDFWEMNDEGKAYPTKAEKGKHEFEVEDADLECNQEAADVCPVDVIKIE